LFADDSAHIRAASAAQSATDDLRDLVPGGRTFDSAHIEGVDR
jgi:hypothetical protein